MSNQGRRVAKLRHLIVNRVSLVDAGAKLSRIELWKRAPLSVTGNAATNSLTTTSTKYAQPCPVCKSPVQRGEGICPSGWTVADMEATMLTPTYVEKQSDVMRTIDYLAKAEHADPYA